MAKIYQMPPKLYNIISAGEVVERPSSVVKELVENAIDANAKQVKIYLKNAGLEEITIIDDGEGMESDDVELSFLPHATSKIHNEYDLYRIKTLGFRGEAIASISSVSDMTISSSTNGIEGYSVRYKAGVRQEGSKIAKNKGTTVVVKNLFFNTPARLKYMKAPNKELSSVMYYVDRIAIAHKELKFQVYNDEKLIFQTTGSNTDKTLIYELYGMDAAKQVITSDFISDGYKCHLVLLKPQIYRSNKLDITMIVNGRFVKNYDITNAVVDAYHTYIPINKYPIGIIFYDLDPLLIDVNVHPTKTEIKIANLESMCERLKSEIESLLKEYSHIPTRQIVEKEKYQKQNIFDIKENNQVNNVNIQPSNTEITFNESSRKEPLKPTIDLSMFDEPISASEIDSKKTIDESLKKVNLVDEKVEEELKVKEEVIKPKNKLPHMEFVASIFGTYLIFQAEDGMYLMDQHAAAERINYEKYYKIIGDNNQPKTDLLVPIVLTFSKEEALYIKDNLDRFLDIGFTLEELGDNDFILRTIPLWAKVDNLEDIIFDIINNMYEANKIDVIYFRDSIAKQIACKSSIKANHYINKNEVDYLISKLNECENPFTCPHGRPTIIKFSVSDIEKMFERIQTK